MELGKGRGLIKVWANTLFAESLGLSGLGSPETGVANGSGPAGLITSDTVYKRYVAAWGCHWAQSSLVNLSRQD